MRTRLIAFLIALFAAFPAAAQQFNTLPSGTVIGRLNSGPGPAQAIPFATLFTNLTGTQSANTVYAGPSTGSAALPTFRALVSADMTAMLSAISTWTGAQSFSDGKLILLGASSGSSTLKAPTTGGGTATLFPGTDTIVGLAATQTLTNKTLTSPVLTTPSLGVATATSINGLNITSTLGTLTIPNNASAILQMTGNFTLNLTATAATTPTFPSGTHTLVGQDTADTLTNKTINAASNTITLRAPTIQKFTTGTGATYTTPATSSFAIVKYCGGGGGGSGSGTGTTGGSGGSGGATTFNAASANGGAGATASTPGAGGTASGGAENWSGATGGGVQTGVAGNFLNGGAGGATVLFGGSNNGAAGTASTGAGGAGGFFNGAGNTGGGGGGGGCGLQVVAGGGATYTYTIGAAGTAGTAGTSGSVGFAGSTGYLEATEF